MSILGIDCGLHGAVAILADDGTFIDVLDMPTVKVKVGKSNKTRIAPQALALLIAAHRPSHAFIESVSASPQMGVSSAFAFGEGKGVVDGILAALGVPVTYVTPATWKRAMQVTADKGSSRRRAMQLWPARAALFQRVMDDGRSEAALIALHGLRGRLMGVAA